MEFFVLSALFLPLISALTLSILPKRMAGGISTGVVFTSFILFGALLLKSTLPIDLILYSLIPIEGIDSSFHLKIDPLGLWMALLVTGVGGLIHLFSIGYMEEDRDIKRYFSLLNFFIFSMLTLVLAQDLLLLFFGWEGVGLASYLLIGFWFEKESAQEASEKAFITNRIADIAFILGIVWASLAYGGTDMDRIVATPKSSEAFGISLLFLIGASGKSAQFPFHVWLPDAMAGPTPVSALIHAATMVTAGVFLIAKLAPLFLAAPLIMPMIAFLGAFTALYGAFSAVSQSDLKRLLAYSTISQLGFMFLALGLGAFYTAIFHLTTHAFMKALLFLSAGNVVHALNGETLMKNMGGLIKKMPLTGALFFVGVIAMSGIPPLSAFFSKDLILEEAWAFEKRALFGAALLASFLTAFYLMRAFLLTFLKSSKEHSLHNIGLVMKIPLILLGLLALVSGLLGAGFDYMPPLEQFLSHLPISLEEKELTTHFTLSLPVLLCTSIAILGLICPFFIQVNIPLLEKGFYVDRWIEKMVVIPYQKVAVLFRDHLEPHIFWRPIQDISIGVVGSSKIMSLFQSGLIRSYAAWMVIGLAIGLLYLLGGTSFHD